MRAALVLVLLVLTATPAAAETRAASALTSLAAPQRVTAGTTLVEHYGALTDAATGDGFAGTVDLVLVPDQGDVRTVKLTSEANGLLRYEHRPIWSETVRTYFPGDATHAPAFATSYRLPVSPRLTVTSPASGTSTRTGAPLVVRGSVFPDKGGYPVTLLAWNGYAFRPLASARVVSGGGFVMSAELPHGSWTLKVGIGRTPGNWVGYSPAFSARRV